MNPEGGRRRYSIPPENQLKNTKETKIEEKQMGQRNVQADSVQVR
jgi:hypothetical protein